MLEHLEIVINSKFYQIQIFDYDSLNRSINFRVYFDRTLKYYELTLLNNKFTLKRRVISYDSSYYTNQISFDSNGHRLELGMNDILENTKIRSRIKDLMKEILHQISMNQRENAR